MDKKLSEKLVVEAFEGEGLKRVVESGDWFVGIKNYKTANDAQLFTFMEKHFLTDEVFVLLSGGCVLLIDVSADDSCSDIRLCPMETGKVYCVTKGVWHNTIVTKDVKMILVENRNTSGDNSEMFNLPEDQLIALRKKLA
ncbi:hypothetical protein [Sporomusa sp.]|uniref:hypothetical protein n=1 Tax=Sporomusa sp. TaxID=2078658 RepID=UPI002BF0DD6E|nr:hypothetical protein [Sporomusa sp.]HWR45907.1 hypothetical protein [Sporomusa sp.]